MSRHEISTAMAELAYMLDLGRQSSVSLSLDPFASACRQLNERLPHIYSRMGGQQQDLINTPLRCPLRQWLDVFEQDWHTGQAIRESGGFDAFQHALAVNLATEGDGQIHHPDHTDDGTLSEYVDGLVQMWRQHGPVGLTTKADSVIRAIWAHSVDTPLVIWLYFLYWVDPSAAARLFAAAEACPTLYEDIDAIVAQLGEFDE